MSQSGEGKQLISSAHFDDEYEEILSSSRGIIHSLPGDNFEFKLRHTRVMLQSMPDAERVLFIANQFIILWEHAKGVEPGTLPLEEKKYWIENAERLVNFDNGNRDPDTLLTEAFHIMKPYLPREEQGFFLDVFSDIAELTYRSMGAYVGAVKIVGDGAIAGGKAAFTTAGEKTKEKIVETVEAFVGRYENVAYLSIAAGLIGTTVLYFKRS